ncbi:PQQ-binding-like beta-propeller repeat protein [Streptomyces sp. HB132]|uniref:serine/threonine-protein kinase n=1 Tax=Streptomyces sp. HB132 TaxID=767388 RepID=UPI0019606A2E|nr:serine/threonine-protein kinase [Streptomyces sp. HB132]MBM7437771.1 serine/threonine protein kinase/outer membrane protein assembly factor BamB [Streptomyces sp. HB132]
MLSPLTHDDPAGPTGFRLLARLGHGGMGTVYLARSAGGRTVALKTMHPSIANDPAARTRFRLETDAARIIGGHHGAVVVDADPLAPSPWLATEYVLGPPLDDAVELCGPLPQESVRALGAALAGALAQLHTSDVVHRDLKPSNVMVTAYGPKIIDFGIARASGDDRLTRAGSAAGTPAFMSPEQAVGQEHTSAGDVFALAGVLLYAATGHGPFGTGQPADLLYRVRYADPDLTGLPQGLAAVLGPCLSKDPAGRPTTHDLVTQLHDGQGHFADHLPDALLADIARRASEVWQYRPERLPAPVDHSAAETVLATTPPGLSRRKLLSISGGSLLATTAIGAGVWAATRDRGPDAPTSAGSGGAPAPLWRRNIVTAAADRLGRPMVVGDKLIVTTDDGVSAVETSSGRNLWSGNQVLSSWDVATDGSRVFAVDYSLDPGEGLRIAQIDIEDGALMDPVVTDKAYNGKLVGNQLLAVVGDVAWLLTARVRKEDTAESSGVGPERGWIIASFSLSTGKRRTELVLDAAFPEEFPWVTGVRTAGSSLVLFFRTESGGVDALVCDTRTGTVVWRAPLGLDAVDAARSPVAADAKHLYTASDAVRAWRMTDGKEAWSYQGAKQTAYGPPAVKDGVVYAVEADGDRTLVAIGADTGELLWREKSPVASGHELKVAPTVGDTHVYKHSRAGLRAIDLRTRETAWLHPESLDKFSAVITGGLLVGIGEGPTVALPLEPSDHASS